MSEFLLRQLADKRQTALAEARKITDRAEAEKRELSADEVVQFDKYSADMDSIRAQGDSIRKFVEDDKAAEAYLTGALGKPASRNQGSANDTFRTWAQGGAGRSLEMPATLDASGGHSSFRDAAARALVKGVAVSGGNTVPISFYDQLVQHLVDASGVLQAGPTVLETASGEQLQIPITTSHGSAVLTTEGTPIPSNDPAFGQRALGAYKYGQLVQVANELVTDTAVDLLGYIASSAGRNAGLAFGAHLLAGTGTSQPNGILPSATLGTTGGTAVVGAFTADDLINLQYSVIGPYRNAPKAAWLVKDSTLGAIRKLKDGSGRYLFDASTSFGNSDTCLGKPIYTDVNMPTVALGAKSVLFGDISRFFVRMAGGVRFERSDEFAFNADLVTFRVLIRGDSVLVDQTGAVKYFAGNAA